MKPYSKDLRIRVLAAVDGGTPREEVAKTFSVSVPSIKCWLKRRCETGDVAPKPIPGRTPVKSAALKKGVAARAPEGESRPDARGALQGIRGRDLYEGLRRDDEPRHSRPARRVAAQKSRR